MSTAEACAAEPAVAPAAASVPRDYNFAAAVLEMNLAAGRANKPAFIDGQRTLTYGQLAERVARFGAALRGLGIRREERVVLAMLDTVDWPAAFLGCLKAGVVARQQPPAQPGRPPQPKAQPPRLRLRGRDSRGSRQEPRDHRGGRD